MLRLVTKSCASGMCSSQERGHFMSATTLNIKVKISVIYCVCTFGSNIAVVPKAIGC